MNISEPSTNWDYDGMLPMLRTYDARWWRRYEQRRRKKLKGWQKGKKVSA